MKNYLFLLTILFISTEVQAQTLKSSKSGCYCPGSQSLQRQMRPFDSHNQLWSFNHSFRTENYAIVNGRVVEFGAEGDANSHDFYRNFEYAGIGYGVGNSDSRGKIVLDLDKLESHFWEAENVDISISIDGIEGFIKTYDYNGRTDTTTVVYNEQGQMIEKYFNGLISYFTLFGFKSPISPQ